MTPQHLTNAFKMTIVEASKCVENSKVATITTVVSVDGVRKEITVEVSVKILAKGEG